MDVKSQAFLNLNQIPPAPPLLRHHHHSPKLPLAPSIPSPFLPPSPCKATLWSPAAESLPPSFQICGHKSQIWGGGPWHLSWMGGRTCTSFEGRQKSPRSISLDVLDGNRYKYNIWQKNEAKQNPTIRVSQEGTHIITRKNHASPRNMNCKWSMDFVKENFRCKPFPMVSRCEYNRN